MPDVHGDFYCSLPLKSLAISTEDAILFDPKFDWMEQRDETTFGGDRKITTIVPANSAFPTSGSYKVLLQSGTAVEEVAQVIKAYPRSANGKQVLTVRGTIKTGNVNKFMNRHFSGGPLLGAIYPGMTSVVVRPYPLFSQWFDNLFKDSNTGASKKFTYTASSGITRFAADKTKLLNPMQKDKDFKLLSYNPRYQFPPIGPYHIEVGSQSLSVSGIIENVIIIIWFFLKLI